MSKLKADVIKYSKKLNFTNLSALRSGNISVRTKDKGIEGFYITPSKLVSRSMTAKQCQDYCGRNRHCKYANVRQSCEQQGSNLRFLLGRQIIYQLILYPQFTVIFYRKLQFLYTSFFRRTTSIMTNRSIISYGANYKTH